MIDRQDLQKLCRDQVFVASNSRSYRQRLIYLLGLIILVFLILMPVCCHHAASTQQLTSQKKHPVHYQRALALNLAKLQELEKAPIKMFSRKPSPIKITHTMQTSKTYQLRQHAPTRMYDAGLGATSHAALPASSTFFDQSHYAGFGNQVSHAASTVATRLAHPRFTVPEGELIHAVLETAINSDLPGMIRALITRPVYSYLGNRLLIPEGSRLIGQYSSQTFQGIRRVMVIWQRILLPNGISIQVDSPGSDSLGQAGFNADEMNTHFFQRFGEASLLSLLSAASANWGVDGVDSNNASQQYRTAMSQSFQSTATSALHHAIAIKPTLKIHQGSKVTVFVARDLDCYAAFQRLEK